MASLDRLGYLRGTPAPEPKTKKRSDGVEHMQLPADALTQLKKLWIIANIDEIISSCVLNQDTVYTFIQCCNELHDARDGEPVHLPVKAINLKSGTINSEKLEREIIRDLQLLEDPDESYKRDDTPNTKFY